MTTRLISCVRWFTACLSLALLAAGCQKTGKLSPALTARLEKEGIVRRADDLTFRRTIAAGRRDSSWEEKRASIVATRETVFLHVNGNPMVPLIIGGTGCRPVQSSRYSSVSVTSA